MRLQVIGVFVAAAILIAAPLRADVHVTIGDGTVSVSAQDATVRQILTEWARVGQMRIVNVERVSGAPITIELTNIPEAQALDTLLRSVSGYLAAPRAVSVPNASQYDRVFILPTSAGTAPRPAAVNAPPTFAPPVFTAAPGSDDQNADDPPQRPGPPSPPNGPVRGPAFNTFPQPTVQQQQQQPQREDAQEPAQPQAYPSPTAPAGVSTPGMVVPAPPQPGQAPNQGRPVNVR